MHISRLRSETAMFPPLERFLRTFEAVNGNLAALTRSLSTLRAATPRTRKRMRATLVKIDAARQQEADRAWALDLPPELKSSLQILLLRQRLAVDDLRAELERVGDRTPALSRHHAEMREEAARADRLNQRLATAIARGYRLVLSLPLGGTASVVYVPESPTRPGSAGYLLRIDCGRAKQRQAFESALDTAKAFIAAAGNRAVTTALDAMSL